MASLLDSSAPRKDLFPVPPDVEKDGWGITWTTKGELSARASKDELALFAGHAAAMAMADGLRRDGHVVTGLLTDRLESLAAISVSGGAATIRAPQEREDWLEAQAAMSEEWMSFDDAVGEATQAALDEYAKQALISK